MTRGRGGNRRLARALLTVGLAALLGGCMDACAPRRFVEAPRPPATTTTTQPPPPVALPELPPAPHFDAPPMVRVWLASVSAEPAVVCGGPCRVEPRGGQPIPLSALPWGRVRLVKGGFRIGAQEYRADAVDLVPTSAASVKVDGTAYPGRVRLIRGSDAVAVVNLVDAESYLLGVLGSEMPPQWPAEALKAQAVAARTYALYFQQQRAATEWDVTSTTDDQMYAGGNPPLSVRRAVEATRGEVLLHRNALLPAFFHSTCGGETESPGLAMGKWQFDFLVGVPCPYCAASPHAAWKDSLGAADVAARLQAAGVEITPPVRSLQAVPPGPLTARQVRIVHAGGETLLTAVDFRQAVGNLKVKSGKFDCRAEGNGFALTGRGLGHGSGMCQYGARGMAQAGKTHAEILMHYYKNAAIEKAY